MTGNVLLQSELTFGVHALENTIGLPQRLGFAFETLHDHVGEGPINFDGSELFGLLDDFHRQVLDLIHERFTSQTTGFHLLEFELPLASHFRRGKRIDSNFVQQINQRDTFVADNEFAFVDLVSEQVLLANQVLDDRGAGGRCTKPTFTHGFFELIVFDQFSGRFHRRQKRTIVVARWRFCLVGFDFDLCVGGRLAIGNSNQLVLIGRRSGFSSVDRQVARHDEDPAVGFEAVFTDTRDPIGNLVLGMWMENRDEPPQHQLVKFERSFVELGWWHLAGWNDRKVIAYLGRVKNTFYRTNLFVIHNPLGRVDGRLDQ